MKLFFFILLLPCITNAQIPDTLTVSSNNRVYKLIEDVRERGPSVDVVKYDTVGPMLRLVSDTAHDHWNAVSAMWVYDVIKIESGACDKCWPERIHFIWLDSKKKPLALKVWDSLILSSTINHDHEPFIYHYNMIDMKSRKYSMFLTEYQLH